MCVCVCVFTDRYLEHDLVLVVAAGVVLDSELGPLLDLLGPLEPLHLSLRLSPNLYIYV